jgi:hypothetical protein
VPVRFGLERHGVGWPVETAVDQLPLDHSAQLFAMRVPGGRSAGPRACPSRAGAA